MKIVRDVIKLSFLEQDIAWYQWY